MLQTHKLLLVVLCLIPSFGTTVYPKQASANCFEVKYLDFFGLNDSVNPNWSVDELDKLIELKGGPNQKEASFLAAPIMSQLSHLYPGCSNDGVGRRDKLIKLYALILNLNLADIQKLPVERRFALLRDDFYHRIRDDQQLPRMIYTMDDGPLYGKTTSVTPKTGMIAAIKTKFGKIRINKFRGRLYFTAAKSGGKVIWSKILTGVSSTRDLKEANVSKFDLQETSLATRISLPVDGEMLTLYLRPNGRFIFYTHSW